MQNIDIVERDDFEDLQRTVDSLRDEVERLRDTIVQALANLPEPPF